MLTDAGGEPLKVGDKVVIPGVVKGELTNGDMVVETKYLHPVSHNRGQITVNAVQTKIEK